MALRIRVPVRGFPRFLHIALLSVALMSATATGNSADRLRPCPESPNCVSSLAADARHRIAPLVYSGSSQSAWVTLRSVLLAQPRTGLVVDEDDYLHAEVRSLIFRFVDDIEFLHVPEQRLIQVRSASRTGYSDFGVNRRRVENIREAFQEKLAN
jgi:uncharacterized protein (DUF1499 family)